MPEKPTYEELEQRVLELERTLAERATARDLPGGKAVEETEGKYRLMVENANEAILVAQDGVFVFSNGMGETLFGYSEKELGSRPLAHFVHESDRRMVGERHEGRLGGDTSIPDIYPFRIIHKSGDVRWVNLKVAVFSWQSRPATLCFMTDITERKRAEEKLRESEARFRAILQNQHVVMMVIDPETGAIRDANPAAERFYGWSYEELTGMNIKDINILPPDEVEKRLRSARRNYCDFFHFQHRLKNDAVRDVEVSSGPVAYDEKILLYSIVRDVTSRKQAEKALKESEARYRAIFDQAAVGITVASPDGHILETNETMCAMLGYRPAELAGLTISDINWLEDAERQRPLIQEVLDGKRDKFQLEKRYLRKDGQLVWVHHSSNVVRKENGVIEYAIGASTDITERKRAEEALRKNQRMLAHAERMANIGSWEWDVAADETTWSEQLLRIWGFDPNTRSPSWRNQREFYHPEDFMALKRAVDAAVREGKPYELALRIRRKDGATRVCVIHGFPETGADGRVQRLFGSLQDITNRKQAEDKLRKSEERLRTVLESMGDEVYVHDASGRFLLVNDAACRGTGYRRDELLRMDVDDIVPQRRFFKSQDRWLNLERNTPFYFETRHKRRDGSVYPVEITLTRILMDEGHAFLALARNITDRKRAEAALQKSLSEKEVLLREIHHRVKNNMQAISGLLRMHARRVDDALLTEIFNDCRDRIGAMSLIHEALYQSENLAEIDFETYLKKLCRNLAQAHDARRNGITLTASAVDVSLDMDQGVAVGMIIAELISNAFKHAFSNDEGGAASVHLDRPDGGETVRLIVSDTGKGLPAAFNLQNPTSLGMRLAVGAVTRELGGTIDLERGNGARFIIRFKCGNPIGEAPI